MGEIFIETPAYAKLILHAVKYPHCAVNGIILAREKDGNSKDLEIVDAIPLFHHSHYVSPMAEVALTQVIELTSNNMALFLMPKITCQKLAYVV